jgi:hypothetical protein
MKKDAPFDFDPANFVPSLAEVVKSGKLDGFHLTAPCPDRGPTSANQLPREVVILHDRKNLAQWDAPPLRTLFRGTQRPPPDLAHYPEAYMPMFHFIEMHVVTLCDAHGDKTDGEFEEWFSNLRRRPDGRSLGEIHDHLWRVLALLLAMRPTSQAEYEGVVGQLALSASHFRMGHGSRNYMDYLRQTFD